MLTAFANLSPPEIARMMDAIPLITILVAAADDDLDNKELAAAEKLASARSFNVHGKLNAYYETIDDTLAARVQELYQALPKDNGERQKLLSTELSQLNPILAKLSSPYDYLFYSSFRSFAEHVAKAHGGFMRYMTVSLEEERVVDLPMLTPIEEPA